MLVAVKVSTYINFEYVRFWLTQSRLSFTKLGKGEGAKQTPWGIPSYAQRHKHIHCVCVQAGNSPRSVEHTHAFLVGLTWTFFTLLLKALPR